MPSNGVLTPFRRTLLWVVIAVVLLASPVAVSATNVSERTYTYERAEVVVDDEDGIAYAGDPDLYDRHLSEDIGCSTPTDTRTCAFERHLVSNATVPTGMYATSPSDTIHAFGLGLERYRYVQLDGTVYEPTFVANRTVQNDDGNYRIDLALESTDATDALRDVSIDVSDGRANVPSVVVEAAREGSASADREVEVPQTPIRVDDGTYYRVYQSGWSDPEPLMPFYATAVSILGPLAGLSILYRRVQRFELTYVDEGGS